MKHLKISIFLLFSLFFVGSVFSVPKAKFKVNNKIYKVRSGGSTSIKIGVYIPRNHVIYVKKKSSLSFSILTQFSAEKKGWDINIKKYPKTKLKEYDYILKGKGSLLKAGSYTLDLFETLGRKSGRRIYSIPIKIYSQICNIKKNICYQPITIKKIIKVKIISDKIKTRFYSRSSINWITSYNTAFSKARKTKQNVFVVITAPTWCGYCKMLERGAFMDNEVQKTLNSKFIPLRILDTNQDKRKFKFPGYPTLMIYSSSGKKISNYVGRKASAMLNSIKRFEKNPRNNGGGGDGPPPEDLPTPKKPGKVTEKFSFSIQVNGVFENIEGGTWVKRDDSGRIISKYKEGNSDSKFIILRNIKTGQFLAIPKKGGTGFIYRNNKWEKYFKIKTKN